MGGSHSEHHFLQTAALRDLVLGISDGLTVPFALAAGLTGAVVGSGVIVTAGLAEIVAGAIAMGLGGYLGGRSEIEHYQNELTREYQEVERIPDEEKMEVRKIFAEYGLEASDQDKVVDALARDKHRWVRFMMKFELGLDEPRRGQAFGIALRIGGGYVLGGILPLLPYFFQPEPKVALRTSCVVALISLWIFGYIKGRLVGQSPILGAFKVCLIGAIAASAAFGIARYANGLIQ